MTLDISAEDQALVEQLVSSGRYASPAEVIHESLALLSLEECADEEWKQQLNERIDAGLADVAAGRYRPVAEFLAELDAKSGG